jgi:hypothetical protein
MATEEVERHVHRPIMTVMTCECGERAVFVEGDRLEAFDYNWAGLDKFFAKRAQVLVHDEQP